MDSQLRQVPAASGLSNAHFYERVPLPRCGTCKNNNRCDPPGTYDSVSAVCANSRAAS